jgi:hypothetical protein
MPEDPSGAGATPLLSVVRGEPDPAELAAVVVVLTGLARQAESGGSTQRRPRLWSSPAASMRPQLAPGPGAWRASALP